MFVYVYTCVVHICSITYHMHACVCAMHVCVCTCVCACIHMYMYVCVCIHMYVRIYVMHIDTSKANSYVLQLTCDNTDVRTCNY